MNKNHQDRGSRGEHGARVKPEAIIKISGTITTIPPRLLAPMPFDTLRIGVPIMRPGFITVTGFLPPSGKSDS